MKRSRADVVVIGAGPAGLAAARSARAQGAGRVLLVDRNARPGGILPQCIHNGFGMHYYGRDLTGPEYAALHLREALDAGAEVVGGAFVYRLTPGRTVCFTRRGELQELEAGAVVLATGCRERTREYAAIPGSRPAGVITAGEAQYLMNLEGLHPGRRAVVLGAGDIGLIMARRLTLEGIEVAAVVDIADRPGGQPRNVVQCLQDFGIPLLLCHTVAGVEGNERLKAVIVKGVDECGWRIACDLLLIAIGLVPESELCGEAAVELDPVTEGPIVDQWRMTSAAGIFAAGNVITVHDLVDWVSREGEIAGAAAAAFARGLPFGDGKPGLPVRRGGGVSRVVPQVLRQPWKSESWEGGSRPGWLFLVRAAAPMRAARLRLRSGSRILAESRYRAVRPGEALVFRVDPPEPAPPAGGSVEVELAGSV